MGWGVGLGGASLCSPILVPSALFRGSVPVSHPSHGVPIAGWKGPASALRGNLWLQLNGGKVPVCLVQGQQWEGVPWGTVL